MSKAMDALNDLENRVIPIKYLEKDSCGNKAIRTLRDYITTTEEWLGDPCQWYSNASWIAYQEKARQSAARIKELEEALRVAQKGMNQRRIFGYNLDKGHLSDLWDSEDAQVEEALSGARKVGEPPMCTRPDLINCHAKINTGGRCMNGIQCEPIDGARKVEP